LVWLTDHPSPLAKEWASEYAGIKNVPDNLELFKKNGYQVSGHFTLPVSSWLNDYYGPMQLKVDELRPRYQGNALATSVLDSAQAEIDGFKKCSDQVGYEFFVATPTTG
jgi:hypothetical protein